ncbi:hypothetical protein BWI96_18890 [Siphonobacter sp. SORGH_AS_0500]|uniref:hypothetical protein n=1 Tax=Siphonobacter sp. SORGH_AS_0500 TaxID=1864824 RepID=UPI000CBBA613|nr:hypothetical protein [Siphonobacter sp. SORGH_AS_0500]PKK35121.1 hypothetical protein BWI96_18890 [Siphonobacter sp. SORGH_AS_0500]
MKLYENADAFSGIGSNSSALSVKKSPAQLRLKAMVAAHPSTAYLASCWACFTAFVKNDSQSESELIKGFEVSFILAFSFLLGALMICMAVHYLNGALLIAGGVGLAVALLTTLILWYASVISREN